MPAYVAIVIVLWVLVILLIARSVVNVPTGSAYVVKRLGRVHRVLDPGLHIIVPIVTAVSAKMSTLEQVIEVPTFPGVTSDNVPASVSGALRLRVADPARAASEVADFRKASIELATRQWRDALRASNTRDALKAVEATEEDIRETAAAWGLDVLSAMPLLVIEEETPGSADETAP